MSTKSASACLKESQFQRSAKEVLVLVMTVMMVVMMMVVVVLVMMVVMMVMMVVAQGSSQPTNQTGVSCIAGGFFTN